MVLVHADAIILLDCESRLKSRIRNLEYDCDARVSLSSVSKRRLLFRFCCVMPLWCEYIIRSRRLYVGLRKKKSHREVRVLSAAIRTTTYIYTTM